MLQEGPTNDINSPDAVERARALAPVVAAAGDAIERDRKLPEGVVSALHQARLFRLLMPQSVSGEEVEPIVFMGMLEEIGKSDASTAWCVSQTSVCSMWAALLHEDVAKRIFSAPDALIASGFGGNTRAVAVDGGYRVTGSWAFGSGAHHAQQPQRPGADLAPFSAIHQLLRDNHVEVVMAGDTHYFECYRETYEAAGATRSMHHFVNGGGGAYVSVGTPLDWPKRPALPDCAYFPRKDFLVEKLDRETPAARSPRETAHA